MYATDSGFGGVAVAVAVGDAVGVREGVAVAVGVAVGVWVGCGVAMGWMVAVADGCRVAVGRLTVDTRAMVVSSTSAFARRRLTGSAPARLPERPR